MLDGHRWLPLAVGATALIPRLATVGRFQTTDETLWIARTTTFSDGLLSWDLSQMSASQEALATMPGVTTMWVGSIGRLLWAAADALGLREGSEALAASRSGMAFTQFVMAIVTSALIAGFVVIARRWCGTVAATTAGVLLATEPFVVAHGSLLHTDELTMLFGINGCLLALMAFDGSRSSRRTEIAAGVMLAGAALTKVSAGALVPGLIVMVVISVYRRRSTPAAVATALRTAGVVTAAAIVTFVVAWPALWVDPVLQARLLWTSATQAGDGYRTFFLGEVTTTSHPSYYLVATPLRMTPWFLLAIALIPFGWLRPLRSRLVTLAVLALPAFVIISSSAKLYDRYVLLVVPHLALAIGVGVEGLRRVVTGRRTLARTHVLVAGAAAMVLAAVHAVAVAPYGLTYFNPLVGGSSRAERTMLIGWGEGLHLAGEVIAERQQGACNIGVDIRGPRLVLMFPCISVSAEAPVAYRVLYVSERQRLLAEGRDLPRTGVLVETVRIRGVDMVEIYDLRRGATAAAPPP